MRENEIYVVLRKVLAEQVLERYGTQLGYKLRRQPQQEGRPNAPTIFIDKIGDVRFGWRSSSSQWDKASQIERLREVQPMETSLQFTFEQNPSTDPDAYTASDVAHIVYSVCQSDKFIEAILPYGLQVLRVADVSHIPYKNDQDRWEFVPHFDLVVKHCLEYIDSVPVATAFEFNIHAVPDLI